LPAHFRRRIRRRIPHPQLDAALLQPALEPGIVPAGFHPHAHLLPAQPAIELLGFFAVLQTPFPDFSRLVVKIATC